jgi:hypothetical protein
MNKAELIKAVTEMMKEEFMDDGFQDGHIAACRDFLELLNRKEAKA